MGWLASVRPCGRWRRALPLHLSERIPRHRPRHARPRSGLRSAHPGRQRGYALHFAGAKQPATRIRRIEKYLPAILAGKGMHDR